MAKPSNVAAAIGAGLFALLLMGGSRRNGLHWPVPGYVQIDDPYGTHRTDSKGNPRGHNGIDTIALSGTPIEAVEAGKVIAVARQPGSCGYYVILQHKIDGVDMRSTYCHMMPNSQMVRRNQSVQRGQQLGKVGNTGRSNQPHLHFGLQVKKNGKWQWVDPAPYFPGVPVRGSLQPQHYEDGLDPYELIYAVDNGGYGPSLEPMSQPTATAFYHGDFYPGQEYANGGYSGDYGYGAPTADFDAMDSYGPGVGDSMGYAGFDDWGGMGGGAYAQTPGALRLVYVPSIYGWTPVWVR